MSSPCRLYYITDRTAFAPDESARRRQLLEKIAEAASAGVDYIQLREKDLPTQDLESMAREAVCAVREAGELTTDRWPLAPALLINSRTDVALAVGADGVHLRSDDVSPLEVRQIWERTQVSPTLRKSRRVGQPTQGNLHPLIGVSCHTQEDVVQAAADGASFAVFAPVFEKKDAPGTQPTGLAMLEQACRADIPVLALGGVTLGNAHACLAAGAAGIAAIRVFQENEIAQIVRALRG